MLQTVLLSLIILLIAFLIFLASKERKSGYIEEIRNIKETFKESALRTEMLLKDEFARNREEFLKNARAEREEISKAMKLLGEQISARMKETSQLQKEQLEIFANELRALTKRSEERFEKLQEKVEDQLKELQQSNEKKLEEMRLTVDEKLQDTLEKRLSQSFKVVSERLEQVYKGLGDMQELARGVGDLKNVLTNVKNRGTWGEVQLERIIEQILTREQYEKNVATKSGSNDRVEIAIKLPGKAKEEGNVVWLPVDAKFPITDYQRLIDARGKSDLQDANIYLKKIEQTIKGEAKKIAEKYIDPPNTTDFAIMFLPVEGLYAEALNMPGLADELQTKYRVVIAGPTTLSALLNSLQMGFRTLAIEKRSSEVWQVLGAVKTEFSKFGIVLEKTKKKLQEASNTIDDAAVRTRAIERKLRGVEQLPENDSRKLLE